MNRSYAKPLSHLFKLYAPMIAEVLNLTPDELNEVSIIDQVGDLILIHYNDDADLLNIRISTIRGHIIDVKRKRIVCPGGVYLVPAVNHTLGEPTDTTLQIKDRYDVVHNIPNDENTFITPWIPGVNVRVWLYNGKVYLSSYKRIDIIASKSRWAPHHKMFSEMYFEAGGPNARDLFPEGARYSPFVYYFLVCHPILNLTSYVNLSKTGFVRYDGPGQFWTMEDSPFTADEIGVYQDHPYELEARLENSGKTGLVPNVRFNVDHANYHLSYGYLNGEQYPLIDSRFGPGESVRVSYFDSNGFRRHLHVKSPPFFYRDDVLFGDDFNVYHRFMMFTGNAAKAEKDASYVLDRHPYFKRLPEPEMDDHVENGTFILDRMKLLPKPESNTLNRNVALGIIWYNFVVQAPAYYAPQVYKMLSRMMVDVLDLHFWIMKIIKNKNFNILDKPENRDTRKRIKAVIGASRYNAREMQKKGEDVYVDNAGTRTRHKFEHLQSEWVTKILNEEDGDILYQMIRVMRLETGTSSLHIMEPDARPLSLFPLLPGAPSPYAPKFKPSFDVPDEILDAPASSEVWAKLTARIKLPPVPKDLSQTSGFVISKVKTPKPGTPATTPVPPHLPYISPSRFEEMRQSGVLTPTTPTTPSPFESISFTSEPSSPVTTPTLTPTFDLAQLPVTGSPALTPSFSVVDLPTTPSMETGNMSELSLLPLIEPEPTVEEPQVVQTVDITGLPSSLEIVSPSWANIMEAEESVTPTTEMPVEGLSTIAPQSPRTPPTKTVTVPAEEKVQWGASRWNKPKPEEVAEPWAEKPGWVLLRPIRPKVSPTQEEVTPVIEGSVSPKPEEFKVVTLGSKTEEVPEMPKPAQGKFDTNISYRQVLGANLPPVPVSGERPTVKTPTTPVMSTSEVKTSGKYVPPYRSPASRPSEYTPPTYAPRYSGSKFGRGRGIGVVRPAFESREKRVAVEDLPITRSSDPSVIIGGTEPSTEGAGVSWVQYYDADHMRNWIEYGPPLTTPPPSRE